MRLPKYKRRPLRRGPPAGGRATRSLARAMLIMAAAAGPMQAQRVHGPWEDATIAPRGVMRAGVGVHFGHWSERFARDAGSRESLGTDFTRDSLGSAILPGIGVLSGGLEALVGPGTPLPLSLGPLRTRLEVTEVRVPVTLEYGLTSRVGLQAVIPYVKNHVHVSAAANPSGVGATLGLNPAWTFTGARQQNEVVVTSLGSAAATLTSELQRCLGSMDASCSAINANREGAADLVTLANLTADAVASVFGTSTVSGSAYAPLAGGSLQQAVEARLGQMSEDFTGFLGAAQSGEWIAARPVPAPLLAAADLDLLLGDPTWGIAGRPLADFEHSHVGDIEVGAKLILLDTFGSGAVSPSLRGAGALRLAVAGIYRLPTGQLDLPWEFTDVGTGDRQADIEVRGFVDAALGSRLWTSAVLRYGIQRPDRLVRRIPDRVGDPFPEIAREHEVSRDLGDFVELEVAPRYVPNDAFALSVLYRYRSKGKDTYAGAFDVTSTDGTPLSLDASVLGIGTAQTEQLLGLALTLSTVRGYALRQAMWPLEVSLVHTRVMSGRGGVASQASTGVVLRLYRPWFGGNPLRPS